MTRSKVKVKVTSAWKRPSVPHGPHWIHFTVLRFIFVYVYFVFIICCIIVTWWGGPGGTEAWSLGPLLPSVLWQYWLRHLAHKNPSLIWPIVCFVERWTLLSLSLCGLLLPVLMYSWTMAHELTYQPAATDIEVQICVERSESNEENTKH